MVQSKAEKVEYTKRRNASLRKQGRCIRCTKPHSGQTQHCQDCKEKVKIAGKALRERRKASSLCTVCGCDMPMGNSHCDKCCKKKQKQTQERTVARTKAGLCRRCGKKRNHYKLFCDDCAVKARQYQRIYHGFEPKTPLSRGRKCFVEEQQ